MKIAVYIENGARRLQVACINADTLAATSIDINEHTAPALLLMYDFLGMRLGQPPREGAVVPTPERQAASCQPAGGGES